MPKVPYQGESAANLLAVAGAKFVSKDQWIAFLEGVFLISLKDALCVVDDFHNENIPNGMAAATANGRAIALISMVKLAVPSKSEVPSAFQEPSPTPEVPRTGQAGKDEAGNPGPVGGGNGKRKATRTRPPQRLA